jgi:L-alanine-DL-glutamate epimerase-like enolase superfamily enzyme
MQRDISMRITPIRAYRLTVAFRDGAYRCSGGRSALDFDSLIVCLETDSGLQGVGEMAPFGAFYAPAFAGGAEIDTAAMVHRSLSTPESQRLRTCDFDNWVTVSNASGISAVIDGKITMGNAPGLGIEPLVESFGPPCSNLRG